jgi:hypothetical protein
VLALFILVPLCGVVLLNLPLGWLQRRAFACAFTVAVLQLVAVWLTSAGLLTGAGPWERFLSLRLSADNVTLVLLLSIGIVMLAALCVAHATVAGDKSIFRLSISC